MKPWEKSFLNWFGGPMQVIYIVWVTLYLNDNFRKMFMIQDRGLNIDVAMYVIAVGAIAVMFTGRWLPGILERRGQVAEASLQLVITRLVTIVIVTVTAVAAGTFFGVPAEGILGLGGVGGLTLGLAAKDILSNLLGGTMLALLRPFTINEEIYLLPHGNFRGSNDPTVSDYLVEEIGWYQTTLLAKDTKPTIVPNGYFLGANVINVTRYRARVVVLSFRIRYDDRAAVPYITEDMRAYLRQHRHVDSVNYPVSVHLDGANADHLTIEVELHVYKMPLSRHKDVKQELIMDMLDILEKHTTTGPAIPYSYTEVRVTGGSLSTPADANDKNIL